MRSTAILLIDLAKRYGGADVRILSLARAFRDTKQAYSVATLAGSDLEQRLKMESLNYVSVPYTRGDARNIVYLRNIIKDGNFGVVDAHNPQSQLWGHFATMGLDVRKISTMHSSYRLEHGESLKGYLYEQIININALQGCHFIAVSEAVNDYLLNVVKIDAKRATLIHNSIAIPDTVTTKQTHPLIEELGWGTDKTILAVVGRLEEVKGHTYLIDAISKLGSDYPQLRCLIIGEGRIRKDLEEQVENAGLNNVIHFAGFRNDVEQLLDDCQLFCLPSLSEGLPYALLEAAVHRIPIIASAVGGMAKFLTQQENAYLTDAANSESLKTGLRWMLDHPKEAKKLADNAYELTQSEYGIEKMLAQTLELYHQD